MHEDILIIRCADADISERGDILSEDECFIAEGGLLFTDKIFFRSRSFPRNNGVFFLRFIGGEHLVKLSVYHHCDVVSRLVKVARDVRREYDRALAVRNEFTEDIEYLQPCRRVKSCCRLVKDKKLRVVCKRKGKHHLCFRAFGECAAFLFRVDLPHFHIL